MGAAKRRGTPEQRMAQAQQALQKIKDDIEAARRLRVDQELQAYRTMVWWQIDMSERRYARIQRAKHQSQMGLASLMGMLYGGMGWDMFTPRFR